MLRNQKDLCNRALSRVSDLIQGADDKASDMEEPQPSDPSAVDADMNMSRLAEEEKKQVLTEIAEDAPKRLSGNGKFPTTLQAALQLSKSITFSFQMLSAYFFDFLCTTIYYNGQLEIVLVCFVMLVVVHDIS